MIKSWTSYAPLKLAVASRSWGIFLLAQLLALHIWAAPAIAQFGLGDKFSDSFGGFGGGGGGDDPVTISASWSPVEGEKPAILYVKGKIEPGWHFYSLTQPKGGPQRAKMTIDEGAGVKLLGPFVPIPEPHKTIDQTVWVGLELQEHDGEVLWYAPIQLPEGTGAGLTITGKLTGQACKDACVPVRLSFEAGQGEAIEIGPIAYFENSEAVAEGEAMPSNSPTSSPTGDAGVLASDANSNSGLGEAAMQVTSAIGEIRLPGSAVTVRGELVPAVVPPGGSAELRITVQPAGDFHVYALADGDTELGGKPSLLFLQPNDRFRAGRIFASSSAQRLDQSGIGWPAAYIHHEPVTWTVPIHVSREATGMVELRGRFGYQACEGQGSGEGSCEIPQAVSFAAGLQIGEQSTSGVAAPVAFQAAKYADVSKMADVNSSSVSGGTLPIEPGSETESASSPVLSGEGAAQTDAFDLSKLQIEEAGGSLPYYLVLAFAGGLVLNLMPCVLPVIGLKVMSFVEQAGQSRSKAMMLNLWYSAGIVVVFLALALLAVVFQFSWGGQFGNTTFNVILASLVFAMALSLLGVWEIPIPGFFGHGKTQEIAEQEGPLGAFLKGVVTTILATPCTGPFMGTALGWAVRQPTTSIFAVFFAVGVGMASPYLLIGAYPSLIRFLPKPGMWMETFKQIMGFVLLATVAFLLSFMNPAAVVPTVILFIAIGLACWLIAAIPYSASFGQKMTRWGTCGAIVAAAATFSFGYLYTSPAQLAELRGEEPSRDTSLTLSSQPWQDFSLERLGALALRERKTVLVDFSADWCLICKTLEKTVLHTDKVEEAIDRHDVVTMYADFTDYPAEIEDTLRALHSNGVPVIAIFPAANPYEPIVFRGSYSQSALLEAIQESAPQVIGGRF